MLCVIPYLTSTQYSSEGSLLAGAARIDITLPESAFAEADAWCAAIGLRIKQQSPAAKTMVITNANGCTPNNHYIYSDAASHQLTYLIITSHLKPGCTE